MSTSPDQHTDTLPGGSRRALLSMGLITLARDRHGYRTPDELAMAMAAKYASLPKNSGRVTADTIRNLWKDKTTKANQSTILAICDFLSLDIDDVVADGPRPYYLDPIPVPKDFAEDELVGGRRMLYAGHIDDGRYRTEMKLVLSSESRDLSEALISGDSPPSFCSIAQKLHFMLLPSAKLKDIQMTDLEYNHFVSVSLIVRLSSLG